MDKPIAQNLDFLKCRQILKGDTQFSSQHAHQNFPLASCDSGLYICSSNNSDTALESDTDSSNFSSKPSQDVSLHTALQDVTKLRSELERLTKSEQWYKQELRNQKKTRLEDLERLYSRERKYMEENQRLQKECVRLYDKCSELEREAEGQQLGTDNSGFELSKHGAYVTDGSTNAFELQQQLSIINDQQQLISVLRAQKKGLLRDLKSLTEEKDEQIMKFQKCLADLEFDNKHITKNYEEFSKERSLLASRLIESEGKLSLALNEKLCLQKSLVSLEEQLEVQQKLVEFKENEITRLQIEFRDKISSEYDLDEVHRLSLKYNEDINIKSLQIIELKNRLSSLEVELESLQELQAQHEEQQRHIEQLQFSLESCRLELQEIRKSEILHNKLINELKEENELLVLEKEDIDRKALQQKQQFEDICQELRSARDEYAAIQKLYQDTKFKLEICELERNKFNFQGENDQREIKELRQKLTEYLQQTSDLVEKLQDLENKLKQTVEENVQMKNEFGKLQKELEYLIPKSADNADNQTKYYDYCNDFLRLSREFKRLQCVLDPNKESNPIDECLVSPQEVEIFEEDVALRNQYANKEDNMEDLKISLNIKRQLVDNRTTDRKQKQTFKGLLNENADLRKRIVEIENEASSLKLKHDIGDVAQKCQNMQIRLAEQEQKVEDLQKRLLINDSQLYKSEKQLKIQQEETTSIMDLFRDNQLLKADIDRELCKKAKLKEQLETSNKHLETMKQKLEEFTSLKKGKVHKAVQCDMGAQDEVCLELKYLKQQILDLQRKQEQQFFNETLKSEERTQLLQKLSDLQDSKMEYLRDNQKGWQDMLQALKHVQFMEEQTRKELELKRMELEELNEVFAEQNDELKKLEEVTAVLELQRQQEKDQITRTFQEELFAMKKQLLQYQHEIKKLQEINKILQEQNIKIQQDSEEDYASAVANYKKEAASSLNTKIENAIQERNPSLQRVRDLETELHDIKKNRCEAVFLPQLTICNIASNPERKPQSSSNDKIKSEQDQLRILTKVIEAEFARKMERYDEHIHSLLTNVSALKKSLRANEHKTAILSEERSQAMKDLKDLQSTKRNLEELHLKYQKSQNTIKELRRELSFERQKFESSDIGKSTQNEAPSYEVANLIDDYKKLIQQSASVTKRPATSVILDLIQRSNQCVPNCKQIESSIDDLRSDLQTFLTTYAQKIPSSFVNTTSLNVPPSLMDELKAASHSF